jgi:RecB family exonuclease
MTEKRPVRDELFGENLSASRLKKFAQCPLSWWFDYSKQEDRKKPSAGYLEKGTAVHNSIEEVMINHPDIRDAGTLAHKFKKHYRAVENPDISEKMYEDGLDCCDNAAKFVAEHLDEEVLGIEVEHQYHVGGEVNADFNAKMDITTEKGVVDWKTGNAKNSDGEVADYRKRDELIQGMVYAAAYLNKYGRDPEYVKFVYLGDGNVRPRYPDSSMWSQTKQYARALQQAMGSGEFPAKTGSHCSFCDYEFVCPAQETSMANVSYWKF